MAKFKKEVLKIVKNILNKNKNPEIPYHRVIRSDGRVGGYNKGRRQKVLLLKKEGVNVISGKVAP